MFGWMFRGKDDAKLGSKPGILRLRLKPNQSLDSKFFHRGRFIFDNLPRKKFVQARCVIFQCCCTQKQNGKSTKWILNRSAIRSSNSLICMGLTVGGVVKISHKKIWHLITSYLRVVAVLILLKTYDFLVFHAIILVETVSTPLAAKSLTVSSNCPNCIRLLFCKVGILPTFSILLNITESKY